MDLSGLLEVYHGRIEQQHLDFNKHVNVMWYTHFFDLATRALFEHIGCGESYLAQEHKSMFALESHIRYLKELHLDDEFKVFARVIDKSDKRIHFMLFLQHQAQEFISSSSEFVGMHINMDKRKSEAFTENISKAINELIVKHQKLNWQPPLCDKMKA